MKKIIRLLSNRALQHLVFWVLSFYFIGAYFSVSNEIKTIDAVYAAFFHIPLLVMVYANLYLLVPLLSKDKFLIYFPSVFSLLIFTLGIHEVIFEYIIPILPTGYFIVSFIDATMLILIFGIYLIITTLLKFSRSWFHLQQLEKEKTKWEFDSLKAQVNPHFLLNSLNTIYGLALKNDPNTSETILKLSDLLKHTLYKTQDQFIKLEEELEYLQNYISLQKLRLSDRSVINFEVNGEIENVCIPPLILLTFIENSFKHGQKSGETDEYLFEVAMKNKNLIFKAKNKFREKTTALKPLKGIGLENVKKRLDLTYGNKYDLDIEKENGWFVVRLVIRDILSANKSGNEIKLVSYRR